MLHRFAGLVETLVVYPERMRENLESSRGLVFSGTLLLLLAEKGLTPRGRLPAGAGATRWTPGRRAAHFKRARARRSRDRAACSSKEEIERAFDLDAALRHVDAIFDAHAGEERP